MENLQIEKTVKTPLIYGDTKGIINIEGISVPEDGMTFYKPLKDWLDQYANEAAPKTTCTVRLDYFNTSTAVILLNIFRLLEKIHTGGNEVSIIWQHEKNDFEIEEAGQDFKNLLTLPFTIVEKDTR